VSHVIADVFNLRAEAFRYAGDEFIVIIYDEENLVQVIEDLCEKVKNLSVLWRGNLIHTSISVGFAVNDDNVTNWAALIQLADEDLYRVKKGRNSHI
jgi:diguanylate cyclase (GGDEF)-like protein